MILPRPGRSFNVTCYITATPPLSCNALQSNVMNACLHQYKEPYNRIECLFRGSVFMCACMWVSGWGKGGGSTAFDSQYLKIRPLPCSTSWKICGKIILRVIMCTSYWNYWKTFFCATFVKLEWSLTEKVNSNWGKVRKQTKGEIGGNVISPLDKVHSHTTIMGKIQLQENGNAINHHNT